MLWAITDSKLISEVRIIKYFIITPLFFLIMQVFYPTKLRLEIILELIVFPGKQSAVPDGVFCSSR